MTDQELAQAVVRGSDAACALFVDRYRALCFRVVRRFVPSDDEALDLCQDVFIRALDRMAQYRGDGSLAAWVAQLAFNIGRRRVEQHRARREVEWTDADWIAGAADPSIVATRSDVQEQLEHAEAVESLQAALRQLSNAEQLVMTLFYLDELSLTEITQVTGLATGTVKSHLSRGRQRLRRLLRVDGDTSNRSR